MSEAAKRYDKNMAALAEKTAREICGNWRELKHNLFLLAKVEIDMGPEKNWDSTSAFEGEFGSVLAGLYSDARDEYQRQRESK